jgi:hypothetical protein
MEIPSDLLTVVGLAGQFVLDEEFPKYGGIGTFGAQGAARWHVTFSSPGEVNSCETRPALTLVSS